MKKGDTVLILEIMKMETPVVAPEDGTVASIDVAVGDSVVWRITCNFKLIPRRKTL